MKSTQQGFVVPFLITLIALVLIGGGVYIYSTQDKPAPTENDPISPVAEVVIDSITPTTFSVGDAITVKGKGFLGHDTLVWIYTANGKDTINKIKGVLWGGMPDSDTELIIKVPMQICAEYTGASGEPCTEFITLGAGGGTNEIYVENQNGKSNIQSVRIKCTACGPEGY